MNKGWSVIWERKWIEPICIRFEHWKWSIYKNEGFDRNRRLPNYGMNKKPNWNNILHVIPSASSISGRFQITVLITMGGRSTRWCCTALTSLKRIKLNRCFCIKSRLQLPFWSTFERWKFDIAPLKDSWINNELRIIDQSGSKKPIP